MKTVIVDGIRFALYNGSMYYVNINQQKLLHRHVWEKENGKIPKGWEIHHIDGDTTNNDISNLKALPMLEHKAIHTEELRNDPERLEKVRLNLEINARPKANEWHGSPEGIEWHKEHYENTKHKVHAKKEFECKQCGDSFIGTNRGVNSFCSNKCKSKWRRVNGLDDVTRECEYCHKEFTINKYSKTTHCSKSCSNKTSWAKRKDSLNLQEKQL